MNTQTPVQNGLGNPFAKEIASVIAPHVSEWNSAEIISALEIPADPSLGDYALPCFPLARSRRKAPPAIALALATDVASAIEASSLLDGVEATGGYLNFRVKGEQFAHFVLEAIQETGDRYGAKSTGKDKTICIDFSSPNIAKMFHVGHLRSTLVGAALVRVFQYLGHPTVGINHLGDWGTQFGKLLVAFRRWGNTEELKQRPVAYLQDLYVRYHQDTTEEMESEAREAFRLLETGDKETRALWQTFRDASLEEFQRIYDRLGVTFDSMAGESFYEDHMQSVIDGLAEQGLSSSSHDALIVDLSDLDMPPLLLRKKDEATLYATRDLAAAIYRQEAYSFHKLLYVVGQSQELHFRQLFCVLDRMGYSWAVDCEHIPFGWVKFKDQHLKTREGNIVLLDEVLERAVELAAAIITSKNPDLEGREQVADAVGIGAVIFADLATRRIKDVNFDWDEVLSFDYGSGPYVQYAHARLCSIVRRYGSEVTHPVAYERLNDGGERQLLQKLEWFPRQIEIVAEKREPSYLCSYLVDLASTVNTYLQKGAKDPSLRILADDAELSNARVALVEATRTVIKNGLSLLGMSAPERM
jgi:arginyl-tRNA synthetase